MKFKKHDTGKLQYNLLPAKELAQVVEIFTFGANKYGKDNWKLCEDKTRYIDALFRHLEAWRQGERSDTESGKSHLAHLIANAFFLLYFENLQEK